MIAKAVRQQIREVHDFFADVIRRGQADGVLNADRDPVAEAWIFVAGGLLATIDHRLGGLLGERPRPRARLAPRVDDGLTRLAPCPERTWRPPRMPERRRALDDGPLDDDGPVGRLPRNEKKSPGCGTRGSFCQAVRLAEGPSEGCSAAQPALSTYASALPPHLCRSPGPCKVCGHSRSGWAACQVVL